jgi:hypothetical protein
MEMFDAFASVDRAALAALAAPYGAFCFLIDTLGDPGPVPVNDGVVYRPGVGETISWYSGYREVVRLLYHSPTNRAITFLSPPAGRGAWTGLEPQRIKDLSVAAGYAVGCFVGQYHPCDRLQGYAEMRRPEQPALAWLKANPEAARRLALAAHLMVAVCAAKVYPPRTCLIGLAPDDADTAVCAGSLLRMPIDFLPASEFFPRCLRANLDVL